MSFDIAHTVPGKASAKSAFYRLYGDIIAQLNVAVAHRTADGTSRASIARDADQDPALFSRILSGQSGSNLRTIAAVLAATNYRLKIVAVSCEALKKEAVERQKLSLEPEMITLVSTARGAWTTPKRSQRGLHTTFASSHYDLSLLSQAD